MNKYLKNTITAIVILLTPIWVIPFLIYVVAAEPVETFIMFVKDILWNKNFGILRKFDN